jgi:peptidoglycan/xylan/chitin deacetylase (PgdA/CDA1 family)
VFLVAARMGDRSDWGHQAGEGATELMSWADARELSRLGVAFGSHTLTHPRLTLMDDAQAEHEIQQSKVVIEQHLGVPVDVFSYPYAACDPRIRAVVAKGGYTAACGVDRGPWGLFNLWRAECTRGTDLQAFRFLARGWHLPLLWLREESWLGRLMLRALRPLRGGRSVSNPRPSRMPGQ